MKLYLIIREPLKAFLFHLVGSVIVAFLAYFIVFHLWYPRPLHDALGVTQIFLLVLIVDVVLGPLLTFVFYKVGKKALAFDLFIIILLQFCALGYGLATVAQGRPAWVVFNVDRFDLVQAMEIDTRQLADAQAQYRSAPWTGPGWVGAVIPEDAVQRQTVLFESALGGSDIAQRPDLYRSLSKMAEGLRVRAQPLEKLYEFNDVNIVREALAHWPQAAAWFPLMARVKPMVVLLNKESSEPVAIVDLNPWH